MAHVLVAHFGREEMRSFGKEEMAVVQSDSSLLVNSKASIYVIYVSDCLSQPTPTCLSEAIGNQLIGDVATQISGHFIYARCHQPNRTVAEVTHYCNSTVIVYILSSLIYIAREACAHLVKS